MTDVQPGKPASRVLPLSLIDEPDLAMRKMMSLEGLDSLAESLRTVGQLQELGVIVNGDRYRVAFGHRRRLALARAGMTEARCYVFAEGTALEEAMKVAENLEREDVNPAAEAEYYLLLLTRDFGGDVERLAAFVKRPVSTTLDKLDLMRGDPAVLEAIKEPEAREPGSALGEVFPDTDLSRLPRIALAVARELNKTKEPTYRRLFLHDAITQGANSTTVKKWRQDLEQMQRIQVTRDELAAAGETPSTASPIEALDACSICLTTEDVHDMVYVRVHRSCRDAHRRSLLRG